jgi:hypothetical protein
VSPPQAPAKSKPALEPSAAVEIPDEGKQLTHLTKGRARGPKKHSSVKRSDEKADFPEPPPLPPKRPIIKEEPDSPPPIQSSVWNKPPKPQGPPTTVTRSSPPEKVFRELFPRAIAPTTPSLSRERQKSISSLAESVKQGLPDLLPLRDSTRILLSNFLRTPSQTGRLKFHSVEIIPSPMPPKIRDKERLFVQAWSIMSRVKHVSLPNTEEHVLYEKDMHAFLYMFNDEPGALEPNAIKFLWVGRNCTLGEKEGMEFVRLMGDQHADTQVIRQGHETPLFMRALGGVIVTRTGSRRALDSIEDELFCVRQCLGGISIDQVAFRKGEFCSGFSYVVKKDGKVFAWHGNGSLSEEIAAARRFAGEISPHVKEMMEADPSGSSELWKYFDDREYASADFWRRKYDLNGFSPILYVIEGQRVSCSLGTVDCRHVS